MSLRHSTRIHPKIMSQRVLKYIICGGDYSIFHCNHKCGVCHGDVRQCLCTAQAPQKKKRKGETQCKGLEPSTSAAQSSQSSQTASNKELQRLYDKLKKKTRTTRGVPQGPAVAEPRTPRRAGRQREGVRRVYC